MDSETSRRKSEKKIKVTHYLNQEENSMLMQLYSASIHQQAKKDKSELVCEAIRNLFHDEITKLEQLIQQKLGQLKELVDKTKDLSAPVPLDKGQVKGFEWDELKRLHEAYNQRELLEERIKELQYTLFQYKKLLR